MSNPLQVTRRTDGYYVLDPTGEVLDVPERYETQGDAMDRCRRAWNFHRYEDRPGYVSCDSPRRQVKALFS